MGIGSIIKGTFNNITGGVHDVWDDFTGAQQAHEANETSINLANTAVQRRKADLLAAGFNPLLAVGSAAETPGIRQAPSLSSGISSAIEAYKSYGATKLMQSQASSAQAAANKQNAEADFIRGAKTELTGAQIELTKQETQNATAALKKIEAEVENVKADTNVKSQEGGLRVIQREIAALTERELRALLPVIQARAKNEYGVEASMWGRVAAKARAMLPAAGVVGGSAAALRSVIP